MIPAGGLEFLRDNGASRAATYGDAPDFMTAGGGHADTENRPDNEDATPIKEWDYEQPRAAWAPISVRDAGPFADPSLCPQRFVDGKESGRTIAYIAAPQGFPIPVRLAEIGAVALRAVSGDDGQQHLRCESRTVEKVVSFMADLFPWQEVERFAAALYANGYHLLISRRMTDEDDPRDIAWLNENARYRVREEMFRLERQAIRPANLTSLPPTLADGRLDDKAEALFPDRALPVFGIVKSHHNTKYLHSRGWQTLYDLQPGERTPAFGLMTNNLALITWYLRLCSGNGNAQMGGPMDGIVRVEMTRPYFERVLRQDFAFCDTLSRLLCECRTRDGTYSRAATTLQPIQRAEDALRARFQTGETLLSRFYHLTGI